MFTRMRRKRISCALLVGMQTGAATLENSMVVPQKIKKRTTLLSSNCTNRYLHKGQKYAVSEAHMHPSVYNSTITNSQSMERPQMSMDGWIKKMWSICVCVYIYIYVCVYTHTHTHTHIYIYTHTYIHTYTHTMEYYSAIKSNEVLPFASPWMNWRVLCLAKLEKDKYHMTSLYEDFKTQNR